MIYVNLGSTVKDSTFPGEKLTELIETFRKLPMRILWKWDGGEVDLPRNVMTMRWFPQIDVLSEYQLFTIVAFYYYSFLCVLVQKSGNKELTNVVTQTNANLKCSSTKRKLTYFVVGNPYFIKINKFY